MGTTSTRYTSSVWVFLRVPGNLLLSGCFCNVFHGYQVCRVLGCVGAIYGYYGYQVYFFCEGVIVMGTTGTKYVVYWGVG